MGFTIFFGSFLCLTVKSEIGPGIRGLLREIIHINLLKRHLIVSYYCCYQSLHSQRLGYMGERKAVSDAASAARAAFLAMTF